MCSVMASVDTNTYIYTPLNVMTMHFLNLLGTWGWLTTCTHDTLGY